MPLGSIAPREIRELRAQIHRELDVIWQHKYMTRSQVYQCLSRHTGRKYHTALVNTKGEADHVLEIIRKLKKALDVDTLHT